MSHVVLARTATGYATKDERWTVEKVDGTAGWRLTDTHGKTNFAVDQHSRIVPTLNDARHWITGIRRLENRPEGL